METNMQIEVDLKSGDLIKRLQACASKQSVELEAYLQPLVEAIESSATDDLDALEEFDTILDQLSASPINVASLPADFSRADIYADHD
jgi:hypothetical protein